MRHSRATVAAVLALVFFSRNVTATTWTVPGTVNAGGLNGTKFVSDLAITNPGTSPVLATLALVPANGTSPATVLLSPGQTVVDRNLLQQLWGASGAGATVVTASSPLLIRARTYNTASSGTYGVALPVFPDDRFLSEGDAGDSLWISQSADGATGYRTNVAVLFPDAGGGDATVTVYDAAGRVAGSQSYSLSDPGFQQFSVGSFAGAVPIARAQLIVTRGRAAGYAVVVDNVTGDSSLFAFEDLPAGRQDVLVNGVARASGRNGTFFRTDARIYNQAQADASVTVAFHANQNANPSPASATFTVPAGQILDVVDVLQTLLGLPVGSAGALRFTSDGPVAILCRTSNVDPTGAKPGTYGAQQKPVPVLSFLTSAEPGAVVTGVRQGTDFRTNTGFAAGPDGAAWSLTLKNAAGVTVATGSGSLGAWGWTQPNVQDLFPTTTIPDDATLQVTVTSGSVDVFDSSIDNASGDPVVTPIMPLPAALASSATIGPAGGSLASADGRLTLLIPAGALSAPTPLSIGAEASDAPQGIGPGYVLSPSTVTFAKPLILRAAYGPDDVAGAGPASLALAFLTGGTWYSIGGGLLDPGRRALSVTLPAGTPASSARRAAIENPFWARHLAILRAWEIAPKKTAVLSGGGKAHFSAYYAGPPSSIPCISPFCAAGLQSPTAVNVEWYAGGVKGGDAANGTFAPPTGTSTDYRSPCGIVGTATISFRIADARFGFNAMATWPPGGEARVQIFPRTWTLRIEQKTTGFCPAGIEFSWTSFFKYQFYAVDGGGTASGLKKLDGSGTMQFPNDCLKMVGCTVTPAEDFTLVTLQGVSGTLDLGQDAVVFSGQWTKQAARLGWTVSCQQGNADITPEDGQPSIFGPIAFAFQTPFKQEAKLGDAKNYTLYTIEAVSPDPSCSP